MAFVFAAFLTIAAGGEAFAQSQPGAGPVCQGLFAKLRWQAAPEPRSPGQGAESSPQETPAEAALRRLVADRKAELEKALLAAIHDSAVIAPEEVYDRLWSVPDPHGRILTRRSGGIAQVLVTVMTDEAALARFYKSGDVRQTPPTQPRVWVTLAPEIRNWCRTNTGWPDRGPEREAAAALRILELLGIPPSANYTRFAEVWVAADDVLRPCMDPSIQDQSCNLTFEPDGPFDPGASADYLCWFVGNTASSYRPDGAPWTRLGYTYDYSPLAAQPIPYGASEFMLGPGVRYEVEANYTMAEYCAPQ